MSDPRDASSRASCRSGTTTPLPGSPSGLSAARCRWVRVCRRSPAPSAAAASAGASRSACRWSAFSGDADRLSMPRSGSPTCSSAARWLGAGAADAAGRRCRHRRAGLHHQRNARADAAARGRRRSATRATATCQGAGKLRRPWLHQRSDAADLRPSAPGACSATASATPSPTPMTTARRCSCSSASCCGRWTSRRRRAIRRAARDTAVGASVSPIAGVDAAIVIWRSLRMIREIGEIYGLRPSRLGVLSLIRRMLVTATFSVTADMVGDIVGAHMGGRLAGLVSGKLAEGVYAGVRTARLGLFTMEQVRPLPFAEDDRPNLRQLVSQSFATAPAGRRAQERTAAADRVMLGRLEDLDRIPGRILAECLLAAGTFDDVVPERSCRRASVWRPRRRCHRPRSRSGSSRPARASVRRASGARRTLSGRRARESGCRA